MIGLEHKDTRGIFVELLKHKDLGKYKQISFITVEPNFFRGKHYHKVTNEGFILLEGDCELSIHYEREDKELEYFGAPAIIKMEKYILYEIKPQQQHTLMSRKGAKILAFADREFDPINPDTYIYD